PGTFKRNIVHSSLFNDHSDINNGILANAKLNYKILDNLNYRFVLGLDYRVADARNYFDPRTSDGYNTKGSLQEYRETPIAFTNSHVIDYTFKLPDAHKLKALAGIEYHQYTRESKYVRGEGFP